MVLFHLFQERPSPHFNIYEMSVNLRISIHFFVLPQILICLKLGLKAASLHLITDGFL